MRLTWADSLRNCGSHRMMGMLSRSTAIFGTVFAPGVGSQLSQIFGSGSSAETGWPMASVIEKSSLTDME